MQKPPSRTGIQGSTATYEGKYGMTTLNFRGDASKAAHHLLANTPLGGTVRDFGAVTDHADLMTVELSDAPLSSGERLLWTFLQSLAGQQSVNVARLLDAVDMDCQWAVWWSLVLAMGRAAAVEPVRFGVL